MTTSARTDGSRKEGDQERTRKQLRDMDRLLEEMLALPIGERPRRTLEDLESPEECPTAASAPVSFSIAPAPDPTADSIVTFLAMPTRTDAGSLTLFDQQSHLDPESITATIPAGQQVHIVTTEGQEVTEPAPPAYAPDQPILSGELMDLVGVTEQQAKELAKGTEPGVLHWILIGVNTLYDHLADRIWPFGGLFKWIGTRYLLGLAGILLLLGAVAWACIGYFGWTW
jgi:hypothetical protein